MSHRLIRVAVVALLAATFCARGERTPAETLETLFRAAHDHDEAVLRRVFDIRGVAIAHAEQTRGAEFERTDSRFGDEATVADMESLVRHTMLDGQCSFPDQPGMPRWNWPAILCSVSGHRGHVAGVSVTSVDGNLASAGVSLKRLDGEIYQFTFRLRRNSGAWRVVGVDGVADAVSSAVAVECDHALTSAKVGDPTSMISLACAGEKLASTLRDDGAFVRSYPTHHVKVVERYDTIASITRD